jgi:calcineurin-like phosphoesterase family protein
LYEDYRKQLNGEMILIRGNHDKNNCAKSNIEALTLYYANKWLLLVHRPEDGMFYEHTPNYDLILCGHIHDLWEIKHFKKQEPDYFNVGVDANNFVPITIEEILKKYNKWKTEK